MDRSIVHMDLDSFFVSVELLRRPELRGKPIIIGGSSERGVVASCSYEARKFGVRSAMSSQKAKKLCPDAIFVRGDMNEYIKYSKLIRQIIHDKAPLYQQASIDEFYLDISGMDRFFGIVKWTTELRQTIIKESGLPISCGLSVNKIVSKIATGLSKPNGFLHVPAGTEKEFLAPLPIEKIPMVGKKTTGILHNAGIFDIGTLSNTPVLTIEKLLGKHGTGLWMRANGIDHSPIEPYSERKSISTETTFREDSKDMEMMRTMLLKMVEEVCFTLRQKKFMTGCLTVKIKYANFEKETKQCTFSYTSSDAVLMQKITALFDSLYNKQKYVRLIGVRLSNLVHGNYQASLFETPEKTHNLYTALDKIRVKYGQDAVQRALGKSNRRK
ncbi:MAG: DNA polymerase IV [Cytophaga sp.]|uniref:DNA polymerase IV n=1 Tax=Cytophaga sp. TaxID=29535 RepID=UPI003F7F5E9D